jgi:hypothetical protein
MLFYHAFAYPSFRKLFLNLKLLKSGRLLLHLRKLEEVLAVLIQLLLSEVTSDEMSGFYLYQRRLNALALIASHKASGVELTSIRGTNGAGDVTLKDDTLLVQIIGVCGRNGGKERDGVRMARILEYLLGGSKLDYVTKIHNGNSIRNVTND